MPSWSLTTIALTPDACGLDCEPSQTIKGEIADDAQAAASLPDELNTFYAPFEVSNTIPTARLAEEQDHCTLS